MSALRTSLLLLAVSLFAVTLAAGRVASTGQQPSDEELARRAQALLRERCVSCHGPQEAESGLRLDSREALLAPADSGYRAVVPGAVDESELLFRVRLRDADAMPPEGDFLTEDEVGLLERWIEAGAPWPAGEVASSDSDEGVAEAGRILSERCYGCHGGARQRSGLRLDRREDALAGGWSGLPAIVPGEAEESELVRRVRLTDEDAMPADGEPLTAAEIDALVRWIDSGAAWPEGLADGHWAYRAPARPDVPAVDRAEWPRGDIDRFVLARLEANGIEPSPEADPDTLLRRLSLDLVGLPPEPAELEEFHSAPLDEAYAKAVERLLASPHFGERWGRHWLDLARYADSNGYSRDFERSIWPYRDWVVEALNSNMPFDRFTVEQLAGDLLPEPTRDQLVATGFHRNSLTQNEGGADDEEFRVEAVKNRVETTSTVWLGTTMVCAQCHDHKYDPFEQRDYYELFAFFNQTEDRGRSTQPELELPTEEEQRLLARLDPEIEQLRRVLRTMTPELEASQARWADEYEGSGEWAVAELSRVSSTGTVTFESLPDGSARALGEPPSEAVYSVILESPSRTVTGLRLEVMTDPSLPSQGPGRAEGGNFALTGFRASLPSSAEGGVPDELAVRSVTASFSHERGPVENSLDGDPATGWAVYSRTGFSHQAVYTFEEPIELGEERELLVELMQEYGQGLTIGRFRFAVTDVAEPPQAAVIPAELLRDILDTPPAERTPEQELLFDQFYLAVAPELDPARERLEELMDQRPEPVTTLVMREVPVRRPSHVLAVGNFLSPVEEVEPGVPDWLLPLVTSDAAPTRLDLARWLVHPENPLTARVQVNRWWQRLFGLGLVETENDFGTRGALPSHPDLLDWLAVELVESGWDMKHVLRLMLDSATYRQSSVHRDGLRTLDPRNRLLARQNRLRLEGESIRDSALVASGLLDRTLGGPPTHPPLPAFESVLAADKDWPESEGSERYRRSLYTWSWRNSPYPFFETFDAPGANDACTRRDGSNTPLQALVMANDPMILEAVRALAARILAEGGTGDEERLASAFRWCLTREPSETELAELRKFLDSQRRAFAADPEAASRVVLAADLAEGAAAERAAWTAVARVLFNLDEFVNRD